MSTFNEIKNIIKNVFSSQRKERLTKEESVKEAVSKEMDELWEKIGNIKLQNENSEEVCKKLIENSLKDIQRRYTKEELDSVYAWSRYVKLTIAVANKPTISEIIEYVDQNNYKQLSKRLSDLMQHYYKKPDEEKMRKVEELSIAVYQHIINEIDSNDIASYLALGKIYQNNKEYHKARELFEKITETEEPFNGITALIASYQIEIKNLLKAGRINDEARLKVNELNDVQDAIFKKWIGKMKQDIDSDVTTEQFKRNYVALVTRYARFLKSIGNYEEAADLLSQIPETYPCIYRVYTEQAMLYQKPYNNPYYDVGKAIETFKKANIAISDETMGKGELIRSKKSVLMPLANVYFTVGLFDEAIEICNHILEIDRNEINAINLKNKIISFLSLETA